MNYPVSRYRNGRRNVYGGGFSLASLFANGEEGVLPSGAVFQDVAGTIPAGVGDPVALALDTSQGAGAAITYGLELVTNGDFDDGDTGWILPTEWSVSAGQVTHDGGADSSFRAEVNPLTPGATYLVEFEVTDLQDGTFNLRTNNGGSNYFSASAAGKYSTFYVATDDRLVFRAVGNANPISATNISVREATINFTGLEDELVTNGDFDDGSTGWTLGTGWSVSGGAALCDGTQVSNTNLFRPASLQPNTTYLVEFEILDISSGDVKSMPNGNVSGVIYTSAGPKSEIVTTLGSGDGNIFIQGSADFVGSVSNISVRELPGNHPVQDVNDDKRPTDAGNLWAIDGIDDFLAARDLDLTSATAVTVIMAMRQDNTSSDTRPLNFSNTTLTKDGTFSIRTFGSSTLYAGCRGTVAQGVQSDTVTLSDLNVVTAIFDLAADEIILRVNGVEVASGGAGMAGTTFAKDDLFVASENGLTGFLEGVIGKKLVTLGKRPPDADIVKSESAVAQAAGVSL